MLPRNGSNLGENLARARRGKGGRLSHSLLLIEDRSPLRPLSFVGFRPGRGAACRAPPLTRTVTRPPPAPARRAQSRSCRRTPSVGGRRARAAGGTAIPDSRPARPWVVV